MWLCHCHWWLVMYFMTTKKITLPPYYKQHSAIPATYVGQWKKKEYRCDDGQWTEKKDYTAQGHIPPFCKQQSVILPLMLDNVRKKNTPPYPSLLQTTKWCDSCILPLTLHRSNVRKKNTPPYPSLTNINKCDSTNGSCFVIFIWCCPNLFDANNERKKLTANYTLPQIESTEKKRNVWFHCMDIMLPLGPDEWIKNEKEYTAMSLPFARQTTKCDSYHDNVRKKNTPPYPSLLQTKVRFL
jgi:hypothetical protein